MNGEHLSPLQKRAHVTLRIQAGANTTGTGLGSTLRFLVTHPKAMQKARREIEVADHAGKLSSPIKYEEVRFHLQYLVTCIKEALRLNPPATNLFARVAGKSGKMIEGVFVPPGTEITSNAFVVQRDPDLYAPDPDSFRPERWLDTAENANEMDAASFVFGMGPRVCLGKDIAIMELYKLIPEVSHKRKLEDIGKTTNKFERLSEDSILSLSKKVAMLLLEA
jgi:cytochrome P450